MFWPCCVSKTCILSITTLMYVAKISLVHACSIFIGNLSQGKGHRRSSAYDKNCKVINIKYCVHWKEASVDLHLNFEKYSWKKIYMGELDFWSISNLVLTPCVACKIRKLQVWIFNLDFFLNKVYMEYLVATTLEDCSRFSWKGLPLLYI